MREKLSPIVVGSAANMNASQSPCADTTPPNARRHPFDGITIGLHWATVVLVLTLFTSAWLHAQSQDGASSAITLQVHRSVGVTVWIATAFRLVWRLSRAKLPPFPAGMTKVHRDIVRLGEYGLYALLLFQPATGLAATLVGGRSFALFLWQIPQLAPQDKTLSATFLMAHEIGAWALGAMAAGHAAAALFHHFVLRDDVLQCMAPAIAATRQRPDIATLSVLREERSKV